ncbi:HIT domain-containing protein [Patescibacteria group bacterium]|nr:HIT domain-containing protein [Patescibacteria group bacterium]MBU1123847.1 HIT domain-containing protein [Patescibacteria group bacterium]MBU1911004.1 HIT domain-containing protein [Patescibacteria group bacterium]
MSKSKNITYTIIILVAGIIIGAFLFSGVKQRSFLSLNNCNANCLSTSEALGILASVIVQKTPSLLPNVVLETDKTIVMEHPFPDAPIHYVVVPKKDFSDAIDLATEKGKPYLIDAFTVMRKLAEIEDVSEYRIITNGSGLQDVNFVHFHFRAQKK